MDSLVSNSVAPTSLVLCVGGWVRAEVCPLSLVNVPPRVIYKGGYVIDKGRHIIYKGGHVIYKGGHVIEGGRGSRRPRREGGGDGRV